MAFKFPVKIVTTILFSCAMLALLIRLGFWQLDRAHFKERKQMQAQLNTSSAPASVSELMKLSPENRYFRPVRVIGHYLGEQQYLLDNRTFDGVAGYHVLSVIESNDQSILVNRGWAPVGGDRMQLPAVSLPVAQRRHDANNAVDQAASSVSLQGRLSILPGSGMLLGDTGYSTPGWPKVVQSVDLQQMQKQLGVTLVPALILLDPQSPECLKCRWKPIIGIDAQRHRGYALQWFSLAAALSVLLILVVYLGIRKR